MHQGRRDYTCGECGRQLCTKSRGHTSSFRCPNACFTWFSSLNDLSSKSSLRTHIRNSHPNHDLAEVESRSIIAQAEDSENLSETLPSMLQNNLTQNILSILGMASSETNDQVLF